MVVSLCFLQVFPQKGAPFSTCAGSAGGPWNASSHWSCQGSTASCGQGQRGRMWSILDPTWWKNLMVKKSPIRGSRIYPTYIIYPNVPRRHGPIHHWEGTAMQNIEISQRIFHVKRTSEPQFSQFRLEMYMVPHARSCENIHLWNITMFHHFFSLVHWWWSPGRFKLFLGLERTTWKNNKTW